MTPPTEPEIQKRRLLDRVLLVAAALAVLVTIGTVAAYAGMDDKNLTWFTRPAFALIAVVVVAREWQQHRRTRKSLHGPSRHQ